MWTEHNIFKVSYTEKIIYWKVPVAAASRKNISEQQILPFVVFVKKKIVPL